MIRQEARTQLAVLAADLAVLNWAIAVWYDRLFSSANGSPTSSCEKTSTAHGPV